MVTKLPHTIYGSWMYKDPLRFYRWIRLVNLAAVSASVVMLNDRAYDCGIGEIVTTRSKLASELGCRSDEVRWLLNKLIDLGEITQESNSRMTKVVILHLEDYADIENDAPAKPKTKPKTADKKPSKPAKSPPTIVSRAREVFEAYYQETFESAYYWQAKDATNMQQLLQKISHSRSSRETPLPVDDDSLLAALDKFLHAINKDFIRNNFSVPKINSYYNEIVTEIKNRTSLTPNSNAKHNQTIQDGTTGDGVGRQKCVVVDKLAKAQREWKEKKQRGEETI